MHSRRCSHQEQACVIQLLSSLSILVTSIFLAGECLTKVRSAFCASLQAQGHCAGAAPGSNWPPAQHSSSLGPVSFPAAKTHTTNNEEYCVYGGRKLTCGTDVQLETDFRHAAHRRNIVEPNTEAEVLVLLGGVISDTCSMA